MEFVVGPHRGMLGSGVWSIRRDGTLVGLQPSRHAALSDAIARAADEWMNNGKPAAVFVEWMGGESTLEREFGRSA